MIFALIAKYPMSALNRNTRRRLKRLPQIPSVWEGDRRSLVTVSDQGDFDAEGNNECILWVDGSEGIVRAMDIVSAEMGAEAIVRTLLRAMEHPQSPARPARPSKIVVRDREVQFLLRGVLQELEIAIDYVPDLPLIDELFRGFEEIALQRQPPLPPKYADLLIGKAYDLWRDAPWDVLADHQILSVELNRWDVGEFYVSVMGMLGVEYGILLYRSLDSLQRFRESVVNQESVEAMEQAFLGQDCLFITYEAADEDFEDDEDVDLADLSVEEILPSFGAVHPLEGMRPFLDEEEALLVYMALEALHRFFQGSSRKLAADDFPAMNKRFRIPIPVDTEEEDTESKSIASIKVSTRPEVASELWEMAIDDDMDDEDWDEDEDEEELELPLRDDLIPKDSYLSLGMMPWESIALLQEDIDFYQSQDAPPLGEGLPVVLIQTTRPKAKVLIEQIQTAGGLKGIGFNPGEDPLAGDRYDLGILQTGDNYLYLFGEFPEADPAHTASREHWEQRCLQTKGYCGLIIARGLKGASGGNPQPKDMMAFFEARSLSVKELGLGMLQLMPVFEF